MEATPATDIMTLLEEEVLRVQVALRDTTAGRLQWASALLLQVLADAEAAPPAAGDHRQRCAGRTHGFGQLDNLLGGSTRGCTFWQVPLAEAKPV